MSTEFYFRLAGMIVFALIGTRFGVLNANILNLPSDVGGLIFSLVGSLSGLIATPWLTTRPAKWFRHLLLESPIEIVVASMFGLLFGLILALLLVYPLSLLPDFLGIYLPIAAVVVTSYFGVFLFASRTYDLFGLLQHVLGRGAGEWGEMGASLPEMVIDTSVIIDGRILDIAKTGFLKGSYLVPQLVLSELQNIANSSDPLRRQRGRHGLDILNKLKGERGINVIVIDDDPPGIDAVDAKLVEIAKTYGASLMTNDFNLSGVANVQGVTVLNMNELALALQPDILPGEKIAVQVISEGREPGQGVGYLKDGTLIVVEGGKRYLDRTINVIITRYTRSPAGKMYFGVHENEIDKYR